MTTTDTPAKDRVLVAALAWLADPRNEHLQREFARAVAFGAGCPHAAQDHAKRLREIVGGSANPTELESVVAVLRESLRPFATAASYYRDDEHGDRTIGMSLKPFKDAAKALRDTEST